MRILSTAPSRIGLLGGGTDIDSYALNFGGVCLSIAINLRTTLEIYTGDDMWNIQDQFPLSADKFFIYDAAKLLYPASGGHSYKVISKFDGSIGQGLGSSAGALLALIGAFNKWHNKKLTLDEIANLAFALEQKVHFTGKQDHYACSYGGVNVIEFGKKVVVTPLSKGFIEPILPSLVLVQIGGSHKKDQQDIFRELTPEQKKTLDKMKELTIGAIDYIAKGDFLEIGKLLDIAWKLKKQSNINVSNKKIDDIYDLALKSGAIGGKLLGSGGGGYMLFVVPPEQQEDFFKKIKLQRIDFSVDWTGLDCRIL